MPDNRPLPSIQEEIIEVTSRDYAALTDLLPVDRPPVGYFCPYVPEELIWAAGGQPFRLIDTPVKISLAQAHLPAYCCHPVKSYLQNLLQGDLDFLRGIVFSHSCDAYKGLAEIWSRQDRPAFQLNLMIPTRLESDRSRTFLKAELTRFANDLGRRLKPVTAEALREALALFGKIRELQLRIYRLRGEHARVLTGEFFAQVIRAGFWLDRERYHRLLTELVATLEQSPPRPDDRIPVYLTGNMIHDPYWFSALEDSGAQIVWDDLCSGARTFRLKTPDLPDPLEALTGRYFSGFFCPTKYYGPQARQEILFQEIQNSGARGVIFLLYKYCEPHFFDYPDLRQFLEERGISTLLLEVEDPAQTRGQQKLRIQAFMEMLETE
ncbi:MAG: 2-hydroxyacyl-CoA dehydratase [Deltaproteobacteria bacterium]|nr:2-hydroxyacyl-CoA dehydratase [Deltaproteobacteria bacterium]